MTRGRRNDLKQLEVDSIDRIGFFGNGPVVSVSVSVSAV